MLWIAPWITSEQRSQTHPLPDNNARKNKHRDTNGLRRVEKKEPGISRKNDHPCELFSPGVPAMSRTCRLCLLTSFALFALSAVSVLRPQAPEASVRSDSQGAAPSAAPETSETDRMKRSALHKDQSKSSGTRNG